MQFQGESAVFWVCHSSKSTVKRLLSTDIVARHEPRILEAYSMQNLLLFLIQLFF